METSYREKQQRDLRVLFCFGVSQSFFEEDPARVPELAGAIKEAFEDLSGRFGVRVLGTMDDDELMVGPSIAWPWTAYVLADAPSLEAVTAVCNILREREVGGSKLWKYLRVEARVGRPLFFGNE
ncbi:MAG: hypothetical protein ABIR67_09840 [Gaiellaceae bacterium]